MKQSHDTGSYCAETQASISKDEYSAFERAPAEIRQKIYVELLRAENVRQPPNEDLVCVYRFETAILAVNKKTNYEAWPVLYRDNHFVTVSCNLDQIPIWLTENGIAVFAGSKPNLVARFKEAVLRLHLKFIAGSQQFPLPGGPRVLKSFLIVSAELPRLVLLIRTLQSAFSRLTCKLNIRIETRFDGAPSVAAQKAVLKPFSCLKVPLGYLSISGAVDSALARVLKESMESGVHWVRGFAWEAYELASIRKRMGDEAFGLQYYHTAYTRYSESKEMLSHAFRREHEPVRSFDNVEYWITLFKANLVLTKNMTLARVRSQNWTQVFHRTPDISPEDAQQMPTLHQSRVHLFRAAALASTLQWDQAVLHVKTAALIHPSSELKILRFAAKDNRFSWGEDAAAAGHNLALEIIAILGGPLDFEPPLMNASRAIDKERYLLRYYGFKGDYLPVIGEDGPVDPEGMANYKLFVAKERVKHAPETSLHIWIAESRILVTPRILQQQS